MAIYRRHSSGTAANHASGVVIHR